MKIETLKDLKYAYKTPYAWPGGYPIFMVMKDNGCLCHGCVQSEYQELVAAMKDGFDKQWIPEIIEVNWEDTTLYCDHCNELIESAYGED